MNRSLALLISYLLHPAIYPILGVLLVLRVTPYHISFSLLTTSLISVFIGTYLIPVLISLLLFRLRIIASLEMRQSEERRLPYLVGAFCYYIVAEMLKALHIPMEAYYYLLASTVVIVLHILLLQYHKPSAHLAGIGGFTGLLLCLSLKYSINFLPVIAACFAISGFVASARLRLMAHTGVELTVGYFSGLLIVFGMCYFL